MELVKMTSNGTVSIPAEFRKQVKTEYFQAFKQGANILFVPIFLSDQAPKQYKQKRMTIEDMDKLVYRGPINPDTIGKNHDEVLAMYYDEKQKRCDPSILDHLFK